MHEAPNLNLAQDRFLLRSRQAVESARATGAGITPEELLRRMDNRLEAARNLLAERGHGAFAEKREF